MNDDINYIGRAKELVREYINDGYDDVVLKDDDILVIWCVWSHTHWKVLLNAPKRGTMHYEITYDGEKGVAKVEVYTKVDTKIIPD